MTARGPAFRPPDVGRAFGWGCLFTFDGERLIGEKIYFDMATIMRQVGAL